VAELEKVVIKDDLTGDTEITGYLIGMINTRDGAPEQELQHSRPRWGVNRVWKLRGGTYVLATEAFSCVYHRSDTRCRTRNRLVSGDPATIDDLPDDAVPCWICHPPAPQDLGDDEPVRYEFPRRSIHECETPAQVIDKLMISRKQGGTRSRELPEPSRALVMLCASNDPDFVVTRAEAVKIA